MNDTINTHDKVTAAAEAWLDRYFAGDRPVYVTDQLLAGFRWMFIEQLRGSYTCREAHDEVYGADELELGASPKGFKLYLYELADAIEAARAAKRLAIALREEEAQG
jgi:hypothetical protein